MQSPRCIQVQSWLGTSEPQIEAMPPVALVAHVATCARCRGALRLLAEAVGLDPVTLDSGACRDCQDNLAAYMDIELAEGLHAARVAFPSVWAHLWICSDCAETYHGLRALLQAESEGTLARMPLEPARRPTRTPQRLRLSLPRALLTRMLSIQPLLGLALGTEGAGVVAAEDESSGYHVTLRMQPQSGGAWRITISAKPPIVGQVVVIIGTLERRASFNAAGEATVADVPASALTATAGPDIAISIDLGDGP